MSKEFYEDKMEIRMLLDDDNYNEVLRKCNILETKLTQKTVDINKNDFFFVYFDKSLMFMKFKDYSQMLEYIDKAKLYFETEEEKNLLSWLLMEYYRDNKINKRESLILADEMEGYYIKSNKPIYASSIRVNKALLLCDAEAVKKEIEFVKSIDITNTKIIDEYSSDLFNIYIEDIEHNRLEIARLLKSINNNDLRKKLKLQLLTQLKVA